MSDVVVLTSDNPRSEDPRAIIDEIVSGMEPCSNSGAKTHIEPDRRDAIHLALAMAEPGDIVLIAGKGHEDYQIIGGQTLPFDDRQVAREWLAGEAR